MRFSLIEHRIAHPRLDGGFAPAGTTGAELDVARKGAVVHFPVHGRPAEAGALEDGLDPDDAFGSIGLHWYHLQVRDALLESGLINPLPAVSDFLTRNELGTTADLKANDPRAVAAARTIWRYSAVRSVPATQAAYRANIKAIEVLIDQHRAFQKEEPLSLDQVAQAISELTAWVEILGSLSEETKGQ